MTAEPSIAEIAAHRLVLAEIKRMNAPEDHGATFARWWIKRLLWNLRASR
jgi:hypothetical protein